MALGPECTGRPLLWMTCSNEKDTDPSRCTFICFALSSGIPPQVVMKWTGHSDYKAMKPYIDIAEKVKAEQMAIFEKGLDG